MTKAKAIELLEFTLQWDKEFKNKSFLGNKLTRADAETLKMLLENDDFRQNANKSILRTLKPILDKITDL